MFTTICMYYYFGWTLSQFLHLHYNHKPESDTRVIGETRKKRVRWFRVPTYKRQPFSAD